jgi:molecular chaperone DnaJ
MAAKRDFYEVLEISREADEETIKKAYRKQAMRYHPDRSTEADAHVKFREVSEAYEVLRDPDTRQRYDRYGHAGLDRAPAGGGGGFDPFSIFRQFFDSVARGFEEESGVSDLECLVEVDLLEVHRGTRKRVTVRRAELCKTCSGSGAKPGTRPERCHRCKGSGAVLQSAGFIRMQVECPQCRGTGEIIKEKCPQCKGEGREWQPHEVEVEVPRGVDTRQYFRLNNQGHAGQPGRPRGDLVCHVKVKEHPLFTREGPHLLCRVPVTFSQAALGGPVEIPGLEGSFTHTIDRGVQSGTTLRFPGRGVFDYRARQVGDLLVQLVVETPRNLTPRQEELLREMAEIEQKQVSPERKSFFEKLRGFFKKGET